MRLNNSRSYSTLSMFCELMVSSGSHSTSPFCSSSPMRETFMVFTSPIIPTSRFVQSTSKSVDSGYGQHCVRGIELFRGCVRLRHQNHILILSYSRDPNCTNLHEVSTSLPDFGLNFVHFPLNVRYYSYWPVDLRVSSRSNSSGMFLSKRHR